jgi:hypothetical protein
MFFGRKARQAMKPLCLVLFTIPGKDGTQTIEQRLDGEEQEALRQEILKQGGEVLQINTDWQCYQGGLNVAVQFPPP